MADPVIVMPPNRNLEPDVIAIGRQMLPPGFELRLVPAERLTQELRDADYLMGFIGPLDDAALAAATRLKLVQLLSVGYDRFNLAGARAARVPVAVNGGANAIAVAEHAILLMMATLRHLTDLDAGVRAGRWGAGSTRLYELWSSTVGIVGMGRIGQEVAQRLAGWHSTLIYHDPVRLAPARERELGVAFVSLEELLGRADVVTVHVPLSGATRHLIDESGPRADEAGVGPGQHLSRRAGRRGRARRRPPERAHRGCRARRPLDGAAARGPPAPVHPEHGPDAARGRSDLAELASALRKRLREHHPRPAGRAAPVGRPGAR